MSAALLAALALLAAPAPADVPDPCAAAAAPLVRSPGVSRSVLRTVEAYRASWQRACAPRATVQLAEILGDAEVLALDAATSRGVRALAAGVLSRGEAWPLPAIRSIDGELSVDWAALGRLGANGSVADVRFWRGAAVAADRAGEPAWLDHGAGVECVRLGQTRWAEVARALEDMEAAEAAQYEGHARDLRELLAATLDLLARGPEVCGCVKGDPLAGLGELATVDPDARRGTATRRAIVAGAAAALDALRVGRVKVRWLRETPGGEATGCRPAP